MFIMYIREYHFFPSFLMCSLEVLDLHLPMTSWLLCDIRSIQEFLMDKSSHSSRGALWRA